jgi:hypothetical protein
MCFERITDGAPRFVAHPARTKIQVNKAFVFSEGASDCKKFLVTDLRAVGNTYSQALQTTVPAQPISENEIIEVAKIKLVGP